MSVTTKLRELADRWEEAVPSERANFQLYLPELCEALEVERPRPAGTGYEFEYPVKVVSSRGQESTNFMDLYRAGHFVLEAKDQEKNDQDGSLLREAFGQARVKAGQVEGGPPPYILVLDVGNSILVWDRWTGSFGGFTGARKIPLGTLHQRPEDIELLRDIWEAPESRNPQIRAATVTREIAEKLAFLASSLESRGHAPEEAASFLIRCVFTMFAEDIELIPDKPFQQALEEIGLTDPEEFRETVEALWGAMDKGKRFGLKKFLHFNGHFFKGARALPLSREDLAILLEAAKADWAEVEPSIMGTLLVRALDPVERHRLGAQFTPSEYVQRLVKPTVEDPIRERWTRVQAEVFQLLDINGKGGRKQKLDKKMALTRLREFHHWLRELRFLDPACGSGNFLYATLRMVKKIEAEVLHFIEEVVGHPDVQLEEVGPWQFHGIEIKPWSREIAELSLWIGHFQIWRELHGRTQPPEPVLRDEGNLECRDAVLAWDEIREDPSRSRPDPTPSIRHHVTGELVPDPESSIPHQEIVGGIQADWPKADFIVGNPPFMGNKRMREAFGDGYVEALRSAYPEIPATADFVMYWWHRAAIEVAQGRTLRAGLITTNSITQKFNRTVVAHAMESGAGIRWAIPTHPWVDETGSAAVRVAMTVLEREPPIASLLEVGEDSRILSETEVGRLNSDLTSHADVATTATQPLLSNRGISYRGVSLVGRGFILGAEEALALRQAIPDSDRHIRQFVTGKDLTGRSRGESVIDFGLLTQAEAQCHPVLYDIVRDRVKPKRDSNARRSRRENWWRFGEAAPALRDAVKGLPRFISTPYVSKHPFFVFLDTSVAPDETLVCIAQPDLFLLGVLSSTIHVSWALVAGSRLGVGNDPRYNNSLCFEPFPFPVTGPQEVDGVARQAERLNAHREAALRDERITMTGLYNVVDKLKAGADLKKDEREIHELAACGVLLDLHNELDALVSEAYGWPWPMEREEILARLVELHDQRVEEEKAGSVRWLRPDFQVPRFGKEIEPEPPGLDLGQKAEKPSKSKRVPWPSTTIEQIAALQGLLNRHPSTLDEVTGALKGARKDLVSRHLDTLVLMGEAWSDSSGVYHLVGGASV